MWRQKIQARITKSQEEKHAQAPAGILGEKNEVMSVEGEGSPSGSPVPGALPSSGVGKASGDLPEAPTPLLSPALVEISQDAQCKSHQYTEGPRGMSALGEVLGLLPLNTLWREELCLWE